MGRPGWKGWVYCWMWKLRVSCARGECSERVFPLCSLPTPFDPGIQNGGCRVMCQDLSRPGWHGYTPPRSSLLEPACLGPIALDSSPKAPSPGFTFISDSTPFDSQLLSPCNLSPVTQLLCDSGPSAVKWADIEPPPEISCGRKESKQVRSYVRCPGVSAAEAGQWTGPYFLRVNILLPALCFQVLSLLQTRCW